MPIFWAISPNSVLDLILSSPKENYNSAQAFSFSGSFSFSNSFSSNSKST
jgi:hypothetical protein